MENQRTRLTKKLLKNALIELLKSNSIHELSVIKLCNMAEVNRSTFYKYYENIYDILADIEYDIIQSSSKYLNNLTNVSDKKLIYNSIDELLQYIKNNKEIFHIIVNKENDPYFYNNMFKKLISYLKEQIVIKNIKLENPEYTFSYILSGSGEMIRYWIQNNCEIPSFSLAKLICDYSFKIIQI